MRCTRTAARSRAVIALAAGLSIVIVLAGCSARSSSGAVGEGGGTVNRNATFRIAYPVAPSLDPHDAAEPAQLLISTWPVYDRLIQVSPEATYEPMLATSWKFSNDGKSLTLELRKGVTFSDGTPFNASAVKVNLDNYRSAKGTALQANVDNISKVVVVDEYTVRLDLAKPSTAVLSTLSSTLGGVMISPKALKSGDLASHPVGTGAYVIDSFKPGQQVTYKRRTDKGGIWDPKTGKPAKITITSMQTDAQVNAIKSGQIDLTVWSQGTARFRSQIEAGQLKHTVMKGVLNMVGINFNKTIPPFDNPKVRKAVNYAIDRDAIVNAFMPDAVPRVQPWPSGLPGFDPSRENAYTYNPAKAKRLLREAGYGNGLNAGVMLVAQVGALPDAATAIQSSLADVGIKIELRVMDVYALVSKWSKSGANAEFMYMSRPSIDPYKWLKRLFVNPVWTPGGADPRMTELITGTDDPTISKDKRAAMVGKAVQYATDKAFYAPVWQGVGGFISTPQVKNLDDLASVNGGVADFRHVYMVK